MTHRAVTHNTNAHTRKHILTAILASEPGLAELTPWYSFLCASSCASQNLHIFLDAVARKSSSNTLSCSIKLLQVSRLSQAVSLHLNLVPETPQQVPSAHWGDHGLNLTWLVPSTSQSSHTSWVLYLKQVQASNDAILCRELYSLYVHIPDHYTAR